MDSANNGRNGNGTFAKGNTLSRVPRQTYQRRIRAVIEGVVTEAELCALFTALLAKGKAGDIQAARLVLDHAVGRPTQRIEIDHPTPLFDAATERAAYECVPSIDAGTDDDSGMAISEPPSPDRGCCYTVDPVQD